MTIYLHLRYAFLGLCLLIALGGCAESKLETSEDYQAATFDLGRQIRPIEIKKVKCVISIQSPDLIGDIGELAYDKLYYELTRDVALPFSHAQIQGSSDHLYIPSDSECDEALGITMKIFESMNPPNFPIIKIETPDVLKNVVNLF